MLVANKQIVTEFFLWLFTSTEEHADLTAYFFSSGTARVQFDVCSHVCWVTAVAWISLVWPENRLIDFLLHVYIETSQ